MINTIIFDFDGIIIDTETTEYNSWRYVYSRYNLDIDQNIWTDIIGKPRGTINLYDYLEEQLGFKIDKEKIRAERIKRNKTENDKLKLLPGILEYISTAEEKSMNKGVVSSSDRNWVFGHLKRLKLFDKFDIIICEEDTKIHKPNPDPYIILMNKLGIKPYNAIAIEDSPNGLKAAKAAGIFCVAVPNNITKRLNLNHADMQINALSDIVFDDLILKAENYYNQK